MCTLRIRYLSTLSNCAFIGMSTVFVSLCKTVLKLFVFPRPRTLCAPAHCVLVCVYLYVCYCVCLCVYIRVCVSIFA